jgi:hypothetical protein
LFTLEMGVKRREERKKSVGEEKEAHLEKRAH